MSLCQPDLSDAHTTTARAESELSTTMIGPSRRGNRPSAFDISFRVEDPDDSATTSDASRKRDRGDTGDVDLRVRAQQLESPI